MAGENSSPLDKFLVPQQVTGQEAAQALPAPTQPTIAQRVNDASTRILNNLTGQGMYPTEEGEIARLKRINNEQSALAKQVAAKDSDYGWSSTNFLDPETSSMTDRTASTFVNLGKGFVDAVNGLAGKTDKTFKTLGNVLDQASIPNDALDAYRRVQAGKGTEADNALLDRQGAWWTQPIEVNQYGVPEMGNQTLRQRLDAINERQKTQNQSSYDNLEKLANPVQMQQAAADIEKSIEGKSGLDKFAAGLAAIARNPGAAAQTMVESAPYMVGGVPGMIASSAMQGGSVLSQYLDTQRKASNGQIPTAKDVAIGTGLGVVDGALNFAESVINRTAMLPGSKVLPAGVADRLVNAAQRIAPRSSTAAAALARVAAPTLDLAKNALTEGLVSGAQNQIEENYAKGKNEWDTKGNDVAFFQGIAAATGFGAPRAALSTAGEVANTAAQAMQKRTEAQDPVGQAARNTTPEDLMNPQSEGYNPAAAIRRAGMEWTRNTDATTDEQKAEIQSQAQSAMDAAQNDHQNNLDMINQRATAERTLADAGKFIPAIQERLDQLSTDPNADPDAVNQLQTILAQQTEARDTAQQQLDAMPSQEELAQSATRSAEVLDQAKSEFGKFSSATGMNTNTAKPENPTASDIISHPMSYTNEDLQEFVRNAPANATPAELGTLRALADAKVAENAVKTGSKVNSEIFKSTSNNLSLGDYQQGINTAVQAGDTNRIQSLMTGINNFETSHTAKADIAQQYLNEAKQNGKSYQILKTSNGWELNTGKRLDAKAQAKNGGFTIHKGSTGLVNNIVNEAKAITATRQYMEGIATPSTNQNVTGSTEQVASPEAQPEGAATVAGETGAQEQQAQPTISPLTTRDIRAMDQATLVKVMSTTQQAMSSDTNPVLARNLDALDREWTRRADVATNQNRGVDAPHRKLDDSFKPKAQENEIQRSQAETTTQTEHSQAEIDNESTGSESQQTAPVNVDDVVTNTDTLTETQQDNVAHGALSIFGKVGESLKALREKALAEPKGLQNLVLTGFNQRVRPGFGSPLVAVKDFINTLKTAVDTGSFTEVNRFLKQHISESKAEGAKQKALLKQFVEFHDHITANLDNIIRTKAPEYRYQDFAQFILDENGNFDSNTKTGIAAGIFSWLGENGDKMFLNQSEVAKTLRIKEDQLTPQAMSRMADIGYRQDLIMSQLGQRIYQAMGFAKRPDVDPNRASKLQNALGAYALHAMYSNGYMEQSVMTAKEYFDLQTMGLDEQSAKEAAQAFQNDFGVSPNDAKHKIVFSRPARNFDAEGKPVAIEAISDIKNGMKDTRSLMSKLFGYDPAVREVLTTKPAGFKQKVFGKMNREVPSVLAARISKAMQYDYTIDQGVVNAMQTMSTVDNAALQHIFGVRTDADVPNEMEIFRKGREAKNADIQRSIEMGMDFAARTGNKPFWMPMEVWTNQRIGDLASEFNPQGSKVHRAMGGLSAHQVDIKVEPNAAVLDAEGKPTQYGLFLVSLAQGMEEAPVIGADGKKLKSVDKQTYATFLPAFQNYLRKPENIKAVRAMQKVIAGSATTADTNVIKNAVAEYGMNGQSFAALHNLAQYATALESGKSSVKLLAQMESDGVTNGPILTNILNGSADFDLLKRGGIYREGDNITNMPTYRELGGQDYYELLGDAMRQHWADYKTNAPASQQGQIQALEYFSTGYGARSKAKTLATPFNYSAGIPALKAAMGRATVEDVYSKIGSLIPLAKSNNKADFAKAYAEVSKNLSVLLGQKVNLPRTADGLVKFSLNPAQTKRIIDVDSQTRGVATEAAVNEVAADFIASRDANTSLVNTTFTLANLRYNAAKAALLKQRIAEGKIPVDAKGAPLEGLTQADLDTLSNMIPNMPSATGVLSENTKASGYPMAKVEKAFTAKSPATSIDIYFKEAANPKPAMDANGMLLSQGLVGGYKSTQSTVTETKLTNPGVAMGANVTQGTDAAISSDVISKIESQNVHDANILSPDNVLKGARIQNKAMFDAVVSYHPQHLAASALLSEVRSLADANLSTNDKVAAKKALDAMKTKILGKDFKGNMKAALNTILNQAYDRDIKKLETLSEVYAVNQYGTEGGEYLITDADRKKIGDEIARLKRSRAAGLQRISDMFSKGNAPKAEANQYPDKMRQYLYEASASTGSVPASEVMARTKGKFANPVYNELHNLISGLIPADAVVNVLDGQTMPKNVKGQSLPQNRDAIAWSYQDKNTAQVNLSLSKNASPEVLLHEMTHIALGRAIATADSNPKVKAVLNRTEKLMGRVTKLVSADPQLTQKFAPALANVDEFISWGMTNPEFQRYLDTITGVPEISGRNRGWLGTAFKQFVDQMSGIFAAVTGLAINARVTTALEALTFDTAHLVQAINPAAIESPVSSISHPMSNTNSAADQVAKFSHVDIFDNLASTGGKTNSAQFTGNLRNVISTVADQLYGALGSRVTQNANENYTPGQVWNEAVATGKAPVSTEALSNGFVLTNQEAFAVEAIEAAVSESLASGFTSPVNREIRRTWQAAKQSLKPEDFHNGNWNQATQAEKRAAQQKWNYLFDVTNDSGESQHLSRFVAMAIGHEDTSNLLGFQMEDGKDSGNTAFEQATAYFNQAVNTVSGMLTNTHQGQAANARAQALAEKLIQIELKNRDTTMNILTGGIDKVENALDTAAAKSKQFLGKIVKATGIDQSSNNALNAMGKVAGLAARDQLGNLKDTIKEFRDFNAPNTPEGSLASILTEATNADDVRALHESLLRSTKRIEQDRATLAAVTAKNLNEMFDNNGQDLTKEDRTAMTYSLLRTDLQSVLHIEGMNLNNLHKLVSNTGYRKQQISNLEKTISQYANGNDKIIRAKALGYWMATRRNTLGRDLVLNAKAIATGAATHYSTVGIEPTLDEVNAIDALASMYALSYTKTENRVRTAAVMERELARGKDNGIKMLMATYANLIEDSANTLFVGNQLSRIKGYLPEDTNPHHDLRAVESGSADEAALVNMGYQPVAPLSQDSLSKHSGRVLYVSKENGYQRTVSGTFSLTGSQRKGSSIGGDRAVADRVRADELEQLRQASYADVRGREALSHTAFDPSQVQDNYVVPVLSTDGHIMDFRYMATHNTIDTFLDRNNDFADLVGRLAGQNIDKGDAPSQNAKILEALHEDSTANILKNPNAYFEIGPDAPSERGREIWAMMPYEARTKAASLWGGDRMYIRNDLVNLTFGFRKYSLANTLDVDPEQRNIAQGVAAGLLEAAFGNKAKSYVIKGERGIQEFMQTYKDLIVIRNLKTQFSNIMSNTALLAAYGVNPVRMVKDIRTALVAGIDYRKQYSLLLKYQQQQRAGIGDFAQMESLINETQDRLNANPLAKFIQAGMMPTIVEDVQPDADGYTYGSKIRKKFNEVSAHLPASAVTAARWAVIDKGTAPHKFLSDAAQFSDFAAKYALYKHLTEHARDRLSHTEALQRASDAFVNYDIPATATRQYLDDMGITMFTKYRIRIQRAMFYLMDKRPASVMAHMAITGQFTAAPDAMEPLFARNLGNPFTPSVLQGGSILNIPMPWNLFRMAN